MSQWKPSTLLILSTTSLVCACADAGTLPGPERSREYLPVTGLLTDKSRAKVTVRAEMCVCVCVLSHSGLSDSLRSTRLLCPWDFPGKNIGVGCHGFLQGIFPTQGSNPCLLHLLKCRQILYQLSLWEAQRAGMGDSNTL